MRCIECGRQMETTRGAYHYTESGLDNVTLMNVPIHRCPACHEKEVEIPRSEELHLLIALLLLLKPTGLGGKEARYLRKHLGMTEEEMAGKLGVSRVTVARWEGRSAAITPAHDKHLRLLYLKKQGAEMARFPQMSAIFSTLVESLPLDPKKKELKIRTEDWAPDGDLAAV